MAAVTDAYEYWCNAARDLIDGALPYACLDAAGFRFPGRTGPNGLRVDQLEGFARVGLLMAFYVRSQDDRCAEKYRHFLRAGFAAGMGAAETRWPSTKTNRQVLVEAATISLILRLTRRQVWSTLDSSTKEALLDWMQQALGTLRIPENNWHLFRALIASALVELGGRLEFAVTRKAEFAYIDKWYAASGWYSDGGGAKV